MKFNIKTEYLEKAINMANIIVPKKSPLLALEGIKIEATDDKIIISTTDLENEYIACIDCEVFQKGQTVIPLKSIQQLISKIDYPEITFELRENNLILNSLGFSAELTTIDTSEYPEFTLSSTNFSIILEMSSEEFDKIINSVVYASSYPDDSNPIFAGILMEINNDEASFVATDGSQLAYKKIKLNQKLNINQELKLIIPVKSLKVIQKNIQAKVEIQTENINNPQIICFKSTTDFGEVKITSKLIEGSFPAYKEVIPKKFETNILIHKKSLLDAIKRVMVLSKSKELSGIVIFEIYKNKLLVKSIESELGKAKEEIRLNKKIGKDLIIHFNGKFIETMLNSIKEEEELEIHFIDESSPMKVNLPNNDDFLYLLMPIKITATV